MAVNYYNIGHILDIDAYFFYLKSKVTNYYLLYISLLDLESEEELRKVYPKLHVDMWRFIDINREHQDERNELFNNSMSKIDELYNLIKNEENNTYENRKQLIYLFANLSFVMSNWFCGGSRSNDNFGPNRHTTYCLLFNDTGHFALNTYMYAFYNDIHILGIPMNYTDYDAVEEGCPGRFVEHDILHIFEMSVKEFSMPGTKGSDYFKTVYQTILTDSEIDREEKETLIFALWLHIHESIQVPSPEPSPYLIRFEDQYSRFPFDYGFVFSEEKRREYATDIIEKYYIPHLNSFLPSFLKYLDQAGIAYDLEKVTMGKSDLDPFEAKHFALRAAFINEVKSQITPGPMTEDNYRRLDYYLALAHTAMYIYNKGIETYY